MLDQFSDTELKCQQFFYSINLDDINYIPWETYLKIAPIWNMTGQSKHHKKMVVLLTLFNAVCCKYCGIFTQRKNFGVRETAVANERL
jgi:hypothetical protein